MELLESALRALRFLLRDIGVSIRIYYHAERLRPSHIGGSSFTAKAGIYEQQEKLARARWRCQSPGLGITFWAPFILL